MKRINGYLNDILAPQLRAIGVSEEFLAKIYSIVGSQMRSAAAHRTDERFFRAMEVLVSEEAPFYLPVAPKGVGPFVVLTLRNSPFETLQSDSFAEAGLKEPISFFDIVKVTSGAIKYFSAAGLPEGEVDEDIYGELAKRYPAAWSALEALGSMQGDSCAFDVPRGEKAGAFCEKILRLERAAEDAESNIVQDGYSNEITPLVARQLIRATEGEGLFYTDCFKMISRNPEVVLTVLEFLLLNGGVFVSTNYYITGGYAEKRKRIIKAAHNYGEVRAHLLNTEGIGREHREMLRIVRRSFDGQ